MLEGGAPLKNVIIFFHEKNNSRDFGILFRKWPSKKKHITPHGSQQIIFLFHKGPFYGRISWKECMKQAQVSTCDERIYIYTALVTCINQYQLNYIYSPCHYTCVQTSVKEQILKTTQLNSYRILYNSAPQVAGRCSPFSHLLYFGDVPQWIIQCRVGVYTMASLGVLSYLTGALTQVWQSTIIGSVQVTAVFTGV